MARNDKRANRKLNISTTFRAANSLDVDKYLQAKQLWTRQRLRDPGHQGQVIVRYIQKMLQTQRKILDIQRVRKFPYLVAIKAWSHE